MGREYQVETQDWKRWPKVLVMRRDWTTTGHDHRKELRTYVPSDESDELRREVGYLKAAIKKMDHRMRETIEVEARHKALAKSDRLRRRVHEIAGDRDRLKSENAKLRKLAQDAWTVAICLMSDNNFYVTGEMGEDIESRMQELGIEAD